jgi:hypothetical protein
MKKVIDKRVKPIHFFINRCERKIYKEAYKKSGLGHREFWMIGCEAIANGKVIIPGDQVISENSTSEVK